MNFNNPIFNKTNNNNTFQSNNTGLFGNNNTLQGNYAGLAGNNTTSQPNPGGFPGNNSIVQKTNSEILNNDSTSIYNSLEKSNIDLSVLLNNIYLSYIPGSPQYKFSYIFYNIVNTPFSRPNDISEEEWRKVYINEYLRPVRFNKEQVSERSNKQLEFINKLNESKHGLLESINKLKYKKEILKNNYYSLLSKYRIYVAKFVKQEIEPCEVNECHLNRERFFLNDKEKCFEILKKMQKRLLKLKKAIEDDLEFIEKRSFIAQNLLD